MKLDSFDYNKLSIHSSNKPFIIEGAQSFLYGLHGF